MENKPANISDIDFSPLGNKSLLYRLTHFDLKDPNTLLVIAVCCIPVILALIASTGLISRDYTILIPMSLIYLVAPTVFLANKHYHEKSKTSFRRFAGTNDWPMYETAKVADFLPPSLLGSVGTWNGRETQVVDVSFGEHNFSFLRLVSTDSKENTKKVALLIKYELPGVLSHVILDNKKVTAGFSNFSSGLEETKLESRFPEHFRLLHAPGDQINALSLLTPDVMEAVLNANTDFEIEVAGRYLYFYSFWDNSGTFGVWKLFRAVDRIAQEIVHKSKTARV